MKTRLLAAMATLLVAAILATAPDQARADVAVTQQGVLVGQSPVSGRYTQSFTNYGDSFTRCAGYQTAYHCWGVGFRVARGTFGTSLNAYRIKDGLRNYDFYLMDVDVTVGRHSGSDRGGTATFTVATDNATLVDFYDSKTVRASQEECSKINVGLSTPWPFVSASVDLGSVTFCDAKASLTRTTSNKIATYKASRIARINHLTMTRVVKVLRGQKPRFTVRATIPIDSCTSYGDEDPWGTVCKAYSNRTVTRTYRVTTTG